MGVVVNIVRMGVVVYIVRMGVVVYTLFTHCNDKM